MAAIDICYFTGSNVQYRQKKGDEHQAGIVGAKESEVVCMNSLTTNIHLLFVSFYRPTAERYKIISEAKMFPSDRYLLETQTRFHGFDPDDAIIEVAANRDGN